MPCIYCNENNKGICQSVCLPTRDTMISYLEEKIHASLKPTLSSQTDIQIGELFIMASKREERNMQKSSDQNNNEELSR